MGIAARRYTMAEILFELESTLRRENRTVCPVTDWARANLDKSQEDFEQWVWSHPDYAAPTCADIIRCTGHYNTREATAQLQRLYAGALRDHVPWPKSRWFVERLLDGSVGEIAGGLDPEALKILVGIVADHHPSPKGFFGQPHVLARMPKHVDFTHMRSDAHPGLAGLPMQGRGQN